MSRKLFSLAKTPIGDVVVGLAFGKFSRLIPIKRIEETERVVAFWHPKPFWENHILIVPKKAIKSLVSLEPGDFSYIEEAYKITQQLIRELAWQDDYFLLVNGGKRQEVNQLHFHLGRGKEL